MKSNVSIFPFNNYCFLYAKNKSFVFRSIINLELNFMYGMFNSVAKLCPTLFDPVDYSIPGFPVLHCLPEFAQTHVH